MNIAALAKMMRLRDDLIRLDDDGAAELIANNSKFAFKNSLRLAKLLDAYQIDLSGTDVLGNLPVSHLNGGANASGGTVWKGDGTWGTIGGGIPPIGGSALAGRRVTWTQKANFNNDASLLTVGQGAVSSTGGTGIFDIDGAWARPTAAAGAGTQATTTAANFFTRPDQQSKLVVRYRTPSALASVRLRIGLNEQADAGVGGTVVADAPGATEKGLYFRFSTSAGDTGWVAQARDAGGLTTSAALGGAVATSTIYLFTITANSGTSVTFDVNGNSTTLTTNIPTAVSLGWQITLFRILAGGPGTYDLESVYLESN